MMSAFNRFIHILPFLLFLVLFTTILAPPTATHATPGELISPELYIGLDGSLSLPEGFNGSFIVHGLFDCGIRPWSKPIG